MRTAFAYSKNTVAAQLGYEVGFGTVASMARRFGITTPIATTPAMVLGSSETRLIDMTRAFAAVSARGTGVEPFGVLKVTTPGGEVIYEHEEATGVKLVPDYVAAGMTDLLQTAVSTGTGRAAQIGRPVAGKTGTTSSNKDGYFVGFSSGITTGVWMGRDDNRPVSGLQGGRAPATAFATYMRFAVKDRPVEQFDTDLKLPEWQLEPDDDYLYGDPDEYYFIDESGNLVEPGRRDGGGENFERDFDRGFDRPGRRGNGQPIQDITPGSGAGVTVSRGAEQTARPNDGLGQAASDDFLNRATGASPPRRPPPAPATRPPAPPQQAP